MGVYTPANTSEQPAPFRAIHAVLLLELGLVMNAYGLMRGMRQPFYEVRAGVGLVIAFSSV